MCNGLKITSVGKKRKTKGERTYAIGEPPSIISKYCRGFSIEDITQLTQHLGGRDEQL